MPADIRLPQVSLELLLDTLAVCRLDPTAPLPAWAAASFLTVSRTPDELSITLPEDRVPREVRAERGWRALKVRGPLDIGLVGILAALEAAGHTVARGARAR